MTPFDVVLVPFPFSDLRAKKKRPGLVLASFKPKGLREHSIVAMMTSNLAGLQFPGDIVLEEWREISLPKPTLVRLAKLVTVDGSLIIKKIAKLRKEDQRRVVAGFGKLFQDLV